MCVCTCVHVQTAGFQLLFNFQMTRVSADAFGGSAGPLGSIPSCTSPAGACPPVSTEQRCYQLLCDWTARVLPSAMTFPDPEAPSERSNFSKKMMRETVNYGNKFAASLLCAWGHGRKQPSIGGSSGFKCVPVIFLSTCTSSKRNLNESLKSFST